MSLYAQAHPGMYGLMFRSPERLDHSRPSLHEASEAAFAGLAGSVAASRQEQISKESLSWTRLPPSRATGRWCMVLPCCCSTAAFRHSAPDASGQTAEMLLDAMLRSTVGRAPDLRSALRQLAGLLMIRQSLGAVEP